MLLRYGSDGVAWRKLPCYQGISLSYSTPVVIDVDRRLFDGFMNTGRLRRWPALESEGTSVMTGRGEVGRCWGCYQSHYDGPAGYINAYWVTLCYWTSDSL